MALQIPLSLIRANSPQKQLAALLNIRTRDLQYYSNLYKGPLALRDKERKASKAYLELSLKAVQRADNSRLFGGYRLIPVVTNEGDIKPFSSAQMFLESILPAIRSLVLAEEFKVTNPNEPILHYSLYEKLLLNLPILKNRLEGELHHKKIQEYFDHHWIIKHADWGCNRGLSTIGVAGLYNLAFRGIFELYQCTPITKYSIEGKDISVAAIQEASGKTWPGEYLTNGYESLKSFEEFEEDQHPSQPYLKKLTDLVTRRILEPAENGSYALQARIANSVNFSLSKPFFDDAKPNSLNSLSLFDVLWQFNDRGQLRIIKNAFKALRPGGLLMVDPECWLWTNDWFKGVLLNDKNVVQIIEPHGLTAQFTQNNFEAVSLGVFKKRA